MSSVLSDRLREFKARLPINRTRLDEECAGQAVLYNEIGEFVAELKRDARTAKDNVEFEHSQLRKKFRENPGAFGIAKLTESSLEDAVVTDPQYRQALSAYAEAQYLADMASTLIAAAEERKSMIKDAVTLFVHEYYSTKDDLAPQKSTLIEVTEESINKVRRQSALDQQNDSHSEDVGVGSNERE